MAFAGMNYEHRMRIIISHSEPLVSLPHCGSQTWLHSKIHRELYAHLFKNFSSHQCEDYLLCNTFSGVSDRQLDLGTSN